MLNFKVKTRKHAHVDFNALSRQNNGLDVGLHIHLVSPEAVDQHIISLFLGFRNRLCTPLQFQASACENVA